MTLPLIADYQPDRVIAWRGQQPVTQSRFLAEACALAPQLPEGRAAINLCEDRYRFTLAFAALCLRGQHNLLPPSAAPEAVANIAAQWPGCVIVSDQPMATAPCALLRVDAAMAPADATLPAPEHMPQIAAGHIAALVYTSGSTGQPQAHAKTWGTLVRTAQLSAARLFGTQPSVSIVGTVPPQHMYGLEFTVMTALAAGHAVASSRPFFPRDVAQALAAMTAPRVLVSTPLHLRACLDAGLALPSLRLIVSATAPLDTTQAARLEAAFDTKVQEIYGCTEGGSLALRRTTADDIWRLHAGMRMEVRDDGGARIHGDHLQQPVRLDDRISLEGRDAFRLLGRSADLLKVGGKRASLADMSARLLAIPGVLDGVVFVPDSSGTREARPAALVVAPTLDEAEIIARLSASFDAVLLPRPLLRVASLPRNALGKLPRDALLQLLGRARD